MGLCYSLRLSLDEPGDTEQPADSSVRLRSKDLDHEDTEAYNDMTRLHSCWCRRGGPGKGKPSAGDARRGDTTDGVPIQNGGGGGADRSQQQQLLQKTLSKQKQKNLDKKLSEEKEVKKQAKKVSKHIDQTLKEQQREYEQTPRLLLLGAGESGKSTIVKQMRILHVNGFNAEEKKQKVLDIRKNVKDAIVTVVSAMSTLIPPVPIGNPANQSRIDYIKNSLCWVSDAADDMKRMMRIRVCSRF
ncbi:unnamed protein product [Coregonus sp. 'balchen']|nr:unnamed protein product [Coregonus sp. 'balchen']